MSATQMRQINIHQAKTHLSRLVEEAAAGEDIVIAKAGKPLAKLTALKSTGTGIKLGLLKGKLRVPKDFDAPLPEEVLGAFEGRSR